MAGKAEYAKNPSFTYERAFDAGCTRQTERATGVTSRANFAEERTTAMNSFKLLAPKTLWLGIGIATILLGWTPPCKAQEASPVRFTDTGVEDVYPAKPPAKKPAKVHIATQSAQAIPSNQPIGRKQNTHRPARKRNVVFAPGM
ncbi:MAG TPA: hypothetical protein VMO80_06575 [Terriglobales bacterium]|nr:hypothetical protein [Terriglobales bacterium]